MSHDKRRIGRTGREVFPIGLGCMGMSEFYGPTDEADLARISAALPPGIAAGERYTAEGMKGVNV